MKKMGIFLFASLLFASTAFAVIDQDPNMLGLYFDLTADTNCMQDVGQNDMVMAYVMLTNPTFEELHGFEFGYDVTGNAMVINTALANPQALDVGSLGNHIVGFGSPTICTEATLLVTLTVLYMDSAMAPVSFDLGDSYPSSNDLGLPTLLLADSVLMPVGFSTMDGSNVAVINGLCEDVVATDKASFDSVKSLYR
jgi:hypothetical protein